MAYDDMRYSSSFGYAMRVRIKILALQSSHIVFHFLFFSAIPTVYAQRSTNNGFAINPKTLLLSDFGNIAMSRFEYGK